MIMKPIRIKTSDLYDIFILMGLFIFIAVLFIHTCFMNKPSEETQEITNSIFFFNLLFDLDSQATNTFVSGPFYSKMKVQFIQLM